MLSLATKSAPETMLGKAKGAAVKYVDLGTAQIGFCRACEACHKGPECALDDDGRQILRKMIEADAVVLATPVYLNQVTAQMKTILDRTSHFVHCLKLNGRYLAAVTTSGGGGGGDVAAYLKGYALTVGAQFVGSVDARAPLEESSFASARELGATIVAAVQEKKAYPEQLRAIEAQKARFGQIIAIHKDRWPYEHKYWQDRGWL